MKTLLEFYYNQLVEDGVKVNSIEEADMWLTYDLVQLPKMVHYGDCTKQNVSCKLCEIENLLSDYYKYTILNYGKNI